MKRKKDIKFFKADGICEKLQKFYLYFAGAQRRKQRSCASSVLLHMENNQRVA